MNPVRRIPSIDAVLNRAARVRVRTALNPLLWLTAVVTPVSLLFGAIVGLETWTGWLLIAFASIPVFASLIAYLGFAITLIGCNRRNFCCGSRRSG
jgi:hypothetical protein